MGKKFNVRSDAPAPPPKGTRLGLSRSSAANMTMSQDANYGYAAKAPRSAKAPAVKSSSRAAAPKRTNYKGILGK